tara:strand:+ start:233 stop:535 length:303 start_codon:yes stop_codon:yes gene_type:complete
MRSSVLAFLFCLFSVANAQIITLQKTMQCGDVGIIVNTLQQKFGEVPVWISQDDEKVTTYMLTENINAPSWTLLQMTTTIACVVGSGKSTNQVHKTWPKV